MIKSILTKIGAAAVVLAMLGGQGAALASTGSDNAGLKAAGYLKTKMHADGGYGAKDASTVAETSQAIVALKTAGARLPKTAGGKTPVDYLKANANTIADPATAINNTGKISLLIIALKFAGQNPKSFAGTDWLALLETTKEKATGWYGTTEIEHCWAMLALESAGQTVDQLSVQWVIQNQRDYGGFPIDAKDNNLAADTNTTALAIQALIGAGEKPTSTSVKKALDWLKSLQNKDGGFPFVSSEKFGTSSDASSTAFVIQALLAANQDIESKQWVKAAVTPMGFLMSLQNADGAFNYSVAAPGDSLIATSEAVPALIETSFPYVAPAKPVAASNDKIDGTTTAWLFGGAAAAAMLIALAGLYFGVIKKKA
jgi:hypothetical protein